MRIDYLNDRSGSAQEAHGSDGRLNVSSRSNSHSYYISRDQGRTFSLVFDHQTAAAGEFSVYWKNTSVSSRDLVIDSIGVNAVNAARVKLHLVTGTAAGGGAATPVNLNSASGNEAEATCRTATAGDAITGLTSAGVVDFAWVVATGHEELRLDDRLRVGPGDAIAIEYDEGTSGDFGGVIFGFYEEV